MNKKMLVVSAHAADYVWRAGGTIAKYLKNGASVKVAVLSYGVRGESNDLWKQPGANAESVKKTRMGETTEAAKILGIKDIEFWDLPDYVMSFGPQEEERMVRLIRNFDPNIIVFHDAFDIFNPDHDITHNFVYHCSVMSNSSGILYEGTKPTKQQRLFCFEPTQPEVSRYVPDTFINITDEYEQKVQAMRCFKAQSHLIDYYIHHAAIRGNHARRCSGNQSYKYAESFHSLLPYVGEEFV
jgi:4-oxalomesaconate hydratase